MRRALTTVQIFLDHKGNLIATNRSTARATIILRKRNDAHRETEMLPSSYQELIE